MFVEPLTAIQPTITIEDIQKRSIKLKGSSSLLLAVRKYVGDVNKKRIDLINKIWELAQSSTNFSTRIMHLREYIQKDIENDKCIYKEAMGTFATKVSSLSDTHRREKNLPSSI